MFPRGELARDGWETVVDGTLPGWEHTGLLVGEAADGLLLPAGTERIVVPLSGPVTVTHAEDGATTTTELRGRASVFDGPTDVLYLSTAASATLSAPGRVAVATSPTTERHPTRRVSAAETPVELRGAGASSRQVHNFGTPDVLDAARLIVCEVITPAGNWSSYPPHKHDERVDGVETRLEEIYLFETRPVRGSSADPDDALGVFHAYASPAGPITVDALVRTGDVALLPYGYHGPAVAAPGYDLYYLNVMAGPDPERAWRIRDDPAHAWVREEWERTPVDPRLPYSSEGRA